MGSVSLPREVEGQAANLARQHFQEALAQDFSGNAVEDYLPPKWMSTRWNWFPFDRVRLLGFEPVAPSGDSVYGTVGVDPHEDEMHGPCFILVLFNDGLRFRMKNQEHVTAAGQWFIIDDFQTHEVEETDDSTTYLVWSVPLKNATAALDQQRDLAEGQSHSGQAAIR